MIPENEALLRDWERARKAGGSKGRPGNRDALRCLEERTGGRPFTGLTRGDILDWLGWLGDCRKPSTRLAYFSVARALYNWMTSEEEGILVRSPMHGMRQPACPLPPAPVFPEAEIRALLAACERDRSPIGIRDTAMIRLLADTGGPRASELAGMVIAGRPGVSVQGLGLDLARDMVGVTGKGDLFRQWPISPKTGRAAARWVRVRDRLPAAQGHPRLWVAFRGRGVPVTRSGVQRMLARRCEEAGIPRKHPHEIRHFSYHHYRDNGGNESDAMLLYGWVDDTMPRRYALGLAAERAMRAGHALAIGDRW